MGKMSDNIRVLPVPKKTDRRLPGCGTFTKLANVSISGRMDKNYLVHRFGAAAHTRSL